MIVPAPKKMSANVPMNSATAALPVPSMRDRAQVIGADEIASRAGAFALAKTVRDARDPFTGVIVILLERVQDAWLARWSGADAWFVKPPDPFEVADRLWELLEQRGLVPQEERV